MQVFNITPNMSYNRNVSSNAHSPQKIRQNILMTDKVSFTALGDKKIDPYNFLDRLRIFNYAETLDKKELKKEKKDYGDGTSLKQRAALMKERLNNFSVEGDLIIPKGNLSIPSKNVKVLGDVRLEKGEFIAADGFEAENIKVENVNKLKSSSITLGNNAKIKGNSECRYNFTAGNNGEFGNIKTTASIKLGHNVTVHDEISAELPITVLDNFSATRCINAYQPHGPHEKFRGGNNFSTKFLDSAYDIKLGRGTNVNNIRLRIRDSISLGPKIKRIDTIEFSNRYFYHPGINGCKTLILEDGKLPKPITVILDSHSESLTIKTPSGNRRILERIKFLEKSYKEVTDASGKTVKKRVLKVISSDSDYILVEKIKLGDKMLSLGNRILKSLRR